MRGEFQCEKSDGGVSLEKTNPKYDDGRLVSLTCLTPAFAAESLASGTVSDKLGVSEQFLYGTEQSGSLVSRVDKMERTFMANFKRQCHERVDRVYNRLGRYAKRHAAFHAAQMNAIEWQFA